MQRVDVEGSATLQSLPQAVRHAPLEQWAGYAAAAIGAVALAVLAGWTWDIGTLKHVLPGLVSMNPMTAVCFLLAALSLWLQLSLPADTAPAPGARGRGAARIAALLVLGIALLRLLAYLLDADIAPDQLLFRSQLTVEGGGVPNRMAPNTALNFALLGSALFALDARTRAGRHPAEALACVALLVALLALTGYGYRVREFSAVASFIPMALHTAVLFLLLGLGVLAARPHRGVMDIATSGSLGGAMARRLFPGMVLAMLVLGWLRLEGERRGYYGAGLGVALYTVTSIAVFGLMVSWSARMLHQSDVERARLMLQQRDSEERVRLLLDSTAEAIYGIGPDGRCTFSNRACVQLLGYASDDDLLGKDMHALLHHSHPDGTVFPVEQCPIYRALHANAPTHVEEDTFWRADGTGFCVEYWAHPVVRDGRPIGAVVTFLDITERKEAERSIRELNAHLAANAARLEQSNRELEAFSYTISHDLRAPLRHVDGYARMLQEDAADQLEPEMRRYLDTISESSRRMGMLIDDLLAFSRLGRKPVDRTWIDMNDLTMRALQEVGVDSAQASVGPLPRACADPVLLRQVWVNLLSNAVKYSAPRGADARIDVSGERDGTVNRYRIRDNGVGFDMRYADKLFGVFQRLHSQDEFEGTGVGLAIVHRIVDRHGGRVWADSSPDQGATFTIEIPNTEAVA